MEFIAPWLVVGVLLYAMRRLERWQHQHIFKVGWLLTKNLQTTTIFYYTFFLPGVFVHEVMYWMAAGILNVRAERAMAWPEAQAIAELNLNFIKLARNTSRIKVAIISIVPLLSGIGLIWLITNNVLNLNVALTVVRGGKLEDFGSALSVLLSTPDVWIWVYLVFAIANTMFPNLEALRGWRPVLIAAGVIIALLVLFGVAQQMFLDNLAQPITDGLSRLALIITVVIAIDLLVTGILGTIEALIERVTKDSATFQNGKLVAITREEMLARRQKEQQRAKEERERQRNPVKTRAPAGPPSIYKLALPIPGAPGKDLAEPIIVSREEKSVLPSGAQPSPAPSPLTLSNPQIITGAATVIKNDDELKPEKPLPEAHIELPSFAVKREPPKLTAALTDDEDEEEDEDEADDDNDEAEDDDQPEEDESEDDSEDEEEDEDEEKEERL